MVSAIITDPKTCVKLQCRSENPDKTEPTVGWSVLRGCVYIFSWRLGLKQVLNMLMQILPAYVVNRVINSIHNAGSLRSHNSEPLHGPTSVTARAYYEQGYSRVIFETPNKY